RSQVKDHHHHHHQHHHPPQTTNTTIITITITTTISSMFSTHPFMLVCVSPPPYLQGLQADLRSRQEELRPLQVLWGQLQPGRVHHPEEVEEVEVEEAQEKLHVSASKLKSLLGHVARDLGLLDQRLDCESALFSSAGGGGGGGGRRAFAASPQEREYSRKRSSRRAVAPPPPAPPPAPPRRGRSFLWRVLCVAVPVHLLLLLLLLLALCWLPLRPASDPGCSLTNSLARSFHPMLRYTNGPPPT
ncbi:hypothetical protein CRUP_036017, partial [Coryphaenoides rupestris]